MTPLWKVCINWKWITYRLRSTGRCPHEWTTGDRVGHRACRRCGTWRWFPFLITRNPRQHGMERGDK